MYVCMGRHLCKKPFTLGSSVAFWGRGFVKYLNLMLDPRVKGF